MTERILVAYTTNDGSTQEVAETIGESLSQDGLQTAIRFCEERDISAIHGECILMFAGPKGLHRLHRWVWGILGNLPQ